MPPSAPIPNWAMIWLAMLVAVKLSLLSIVPSRNVTRKIAIGSLVPDSISSVALTR